MALINYTACPVCANGELTTIFSVTDFTVSKEQFPILECKNCQVRLTQNVPDQQTIGPYYQAEAYVSHTNTKKGFINTIYHKVRNYTLQQKLQLIQKATGINTKGFLLDVGAGTGAFAKTVKNAGWHITALEPDNTARMVAKKEHDIDLFSNDYLFTLPEQKFTVITLWHVLEHVHALQNYMQQFRRVLANNGKLIIAVPNYTSMDAGYYKQNWAAYDVPRHLYHFSPQSVEKLAAVNGFIVEKMKPMWFDSFYVSMLSEQYKKGFLPLAIIIGFISNLFALFNTRKCSSVIYILKNID